MMYKLLSHNVNPAFNHRDGGGETISSMFIDH